MSEPALYRPVYNSGYVGAPRTWERILRLVYYTDSVYGHGHALRVHYVAASVYGHGRS